MGINKKLLLLIVAAIPSILLPSHAEAQASQDFAAAISPLPILLNVKPGTSVSSVLRVNNPSAKNERLKVVIKTFTQDGPDGIVSLHDPSPNDTFINWISFNKTEFDAPPGLWQTVKMTINVPKTAAFGYYFAVEFTSASPAVKSDTTGTSIQGAVASFVLLNAESPGEKRQMRITSFAAGHKFYEFLPATFTIRLHNSGNVYAGASGNIFIKRGSKQIDILNVNESHGLVLPGSNRVFTVAWDSGFPVYKTTNDNGQLKKEKNGSDERRLNWNFSQISKLRFGHYTAQLALVYNDGTRDIPITGTVSFWVIPWRIFLFIIILTLGPAALVYLFMRRRLNKRLARERYRVKREAS